MPRKQSKSETKTKDSTRAGEEEALTELERELEPEELESLEEEYEEDHDRADDEDGDEEELEKLAPEDFSGDDAQEAKNQDDEEDRSLDISTEADVELDEDEIETFDEFDEEEVITEPPRRETRQEMLGRLMLQLLDDRERVHQALERVRDLKTQLDDASPRPPEKLKEQYHKAVAELSQARREENFARSDLMQVLSWRG